MKERAGVIHGETPTEPVVIEENGGVKIRWTSVTATRPVSIWTSVTTVRRPPSTPRQAGAQLFLLHRRFFFFLRLRPQGGRQEVVNVDLSQNALDIARQNAELNGQTPPRPSSSATTCSLLRIPRQGRKFDVIVLDPAEVCREQGPVAGARCGYKDINMLAFQRWRRAACSLTYSLLRPDGQSLFRR